jgi:hypothetical protein
METSMPWAGFEPTIPALERIKTVHALDREATVIGTNLNILIQNGPLSMIALNNPSIIQRIKESLATNLYGFSGT